eukprot:TRINITY_DN290_c0_g3_i2.p1 TRINITY_DN290_c0_g3~~TRINITY_DN290_c0_g3_i2.p1  ORF type:complete len:692 (-),score=208.33 TRINITY_DN290_c0_g3_i2:19-1800(-)
MKGNPWMDGATEITDCGIAPGSSFTYRFVADNAGTFWYHSHSATQYSDGLLGPIIVDPAPGDADPIRAAFPNKDADDHLMLIQDWDHETSDDILTKAGPRDSYPGFIPAYPWPTTTILMNGIGNGTCDVNQCGPTIDCDSQSCLNLRPPMFGECNSETHPPNVFVCGGQWTRFRIVNVGSTVPLRIWIDGHNMTIVAKDSVPTVPMEVTMVSLHIGQRYDVMVNCSQDPTRQYHVYTTVASELYPAGVTSKTFSTSILKYSTSTSTSTSTFKTPDNYPWQLFEDPKLATLDLLEFKLKPLDQNLGKIGPAVKRIILTTEVNSQVENQLEEWWTNKNVFVKPVQPLLLGLYQGMDLSDLVPSPTVGSLGQTYSTSMLNFNLNEIYEVVMLGNSWETHPWHIHGNQFSFIKAGYFDRAVVPMGNSSSRCGYNPESPSQVEIEKVIGNFTEISDVLTVGDTFAIPKMGYVVFRFRPSNLGIWMLHCHVSWHQAMGMSTLFSIQDENGFFNLKPPPDDFPICGSMATWKALSTDGDNYGVSLETQYAFLGFILGILILSLILGILYILIKIRGIEVKFGGRKYANVDEVQMDALTSE